MVPTEQQDPRTERPAADDEAALDEHPVVFFDGVCGLCNATVDTLLRWDRRAVLRFAPLQGDTAREVLSEDDRRALDSLVLIDGGNVHRRSAAVVRILWRLGRGSRLLGALLWLVPLPLRDLGYRLVARYRYAWFGKKESCRMPTPEERSRFLP